MSTQSTLMGFFKENGRTKPIHAPTGARAHAVRAPTHLSLPKPQPAQPEESGAEFRARRKKEYENRKPNPYPDATSFLSYGEKGIVDAPIENWDGAWEGRLPPYARAVHSALEYDNNEELRLALRGCAKYHLEHMRDFDPDPRVREIAAGEMRRRGMK